jgi:hypothetical protein
MRLRERHLRRKDDGALIDLDEIFHDADPLQPWIRETENRVLDDNENEWLDDIYSDDQTQERNNTTSSDNSDGSGGGDPNRAFVESQERENSENETHCPDRGDNIYDTLDNIRRRTQLERARREKRPQ